ncbi:MAG TPA: cell division protein FtsK [Planctomycetes bacterium]|nr:cell division protein FtsK [Planctomycetota bacterium]
MNSSFISLDRQSQLIRDLRRLVDERARLESQNRAGLATRKATVEAQSGQTLERDETEYKSKSKTLESEYRKLLKRARAEFDSVTEQIDEEVQGQLAVIQREFDEGVDRARHQRDQSRRMLNGKYESRVAKLKRENQQIDKKLATCQQQWKEVRQTAELLMSQRGIAAGEWIAIDSEQQQEQSDDSPWSRFDRTQADAQTRLLNLLNLPSARFLAVGWPWVLLVFGWIAFLYPMYRLLSLQLGIFAVASLAEAILLALGSHFLAKQLARRGSNEIIPKLGHALKLANYALEDSRQAARQALTSNQAAINEWRDAERQNVEGQYAETAEELARRLSSRRARIQSDGDDQMQYVKEKFEATRGVLERTYPPQLDELKQRIEATRERSETQRQSELLEARQRFDSNREKLVQKWREGMDAFCDATDTMNRYCDERFPDWDQLAEAGWEKVDIDGEPSNVSAVPFGSHDVSLHESGHELPHDPQMKIDRTEFHLPAVLSFPDRPSLLMEAPDEGRAAAVRVMQTVMLRFLTAFPPGKVRFTIIDPIGLGHNFSAFMHLADYDEQLVTSKIWTDSSHIRQRLNDLTEHIENVIQKYLRNEYPSIQEYNEHAGEVAEPYHVLVIANFPENFSEESARKLASIASSGARCGVYTLISVDTRMALPRNFYLSELEEHSATLVWENRRFRWKDQHLRKLPLHLDSPPNEEVFTDAIRVIGEKAKHAKRVEVPFDTVAPSFEDWWTTDSRHGVDVPLGRAGATKHQQLALGSGTSQHVLVSGKTGSGKSTLFHALIVNVALRYSPDEIQLYLIDFKKGVEFKPYATHALPHARVIAIESEREFGLSVLERLDEELKVRGDLFRGAGVQDVGSYRDANPDARLPRILLIIDEFQELFVKEDRLAQEAGLLLDRLVRQGRAFGIHIILGSQTLAGAYSLARSTLGQMAIRIALQCSESDAHLILSEDNTAARLLSRPGEAIYNDGNGVIEGNHPFQVVWLSDQQRGELLAKLRNWARGRKSDDPPAIVFEGNVAADPAQNPRLIEVSGKAPSPSDPAIVWMGAAVAIKEPTHVRLFRQTGANVLVVGQDQPMASGILATAAASLLFRQLAHDAGAADQFLVLNGLRNDEADNDPWLRINQCLPVMLPTAGPQKAAEAIGEWYAELQRRLDDPEKRVESRYLLIHHLGRFRDFRRDEDDFGFSSFDEPEKTVSASKMLAKILKEGPTLGMHTIIWCDSYNNVARCFDRQVLRDFDSRIVFQMSPNDSSNLMDSPQASRLGEHRAYLYSDDRGEAEKFRPYGTPSLAWLTDMASRLGQSDKVSG